MAIGSLGTVSYDIIAQDKTGTGIDSASGKVSKLSQVGVAAGAAMTGIGLASMAMADNINESYLSFDFAIAQVKSLGGVTDEQMELMKSSAIEISQTLPISATEVAEGFYQMRSAGYDAGQVISELPAIANMAVAGNIDMADSVDAVTMVLDVYGGSAGTATDVTNVLVGTVQEFKTTLPELQMELSKNISVASSLGISFNDLAAMAGMLKKDFVSAEEAGTAMKSMLIKLSDPSSAAAFEELGITVSDASGNFVGMDSVLEQLDIALSESGGNVERMGTLTGLFGTEGVRAAESLIRQRKELPAYAKEVSKTTNVQESLVAQLESTSSQLEIAENKTAAAKIAMGESMAPATILLADATSTLATMLLKLPEPLQKAAGFGIIAGQSFTALGPILIGLATIQTTAVVPSLAATAAGVWAVIAPLTPILVAIAAVIVILYLLEKKFGLVSAAVEFFLWTLEGAYDFLEMSFNYVIEHSTEILDALYYMLLLIPSPISAIVYAFKNWDTIKSIISNSIDYVTDKLTDIYNFLIILPTPIDSIVYAFDKWSAIKTKVSEVLGSVISTISTFYSTIKDAGATLVNNFINGFNSVGWGIVDKASELAYNIVKRFTDYITNMYNAGRDMITNFVSGFNSVGWDVVSKASELAYNIVKRFTDYISGMYDAGRDMITNFVSGFNSVGWGIIDKASELAYNIVKRFTDYITNMYNAGKDFISEFISGFYSSGLGDLTSKASTMAYEVWKRFSDYVSYMYNTGKDFVSEFISGFYSSGLGDLTSKASNLAYEVWKRFSDYVSYMYNTGKDFINDFINGFYSSGIWDLTLKASNMAYEVWKRFDDYVGFMYDTGKDFINDFINGFYSSSWWDLTVKASDIAYQVWKRFDDYVGYMYDSGRSMMIEIANGISSAAQTVWDSVGNVIYYIKDMWPFSNAKVGPFSNITEWGGYFVRALSTGIVNNESVLSDAFNSILPTDNILSTGGSTSLSSIGGGSSGVISVNVDVTIKNESDIDQLERMIGNAISAGIHEKYGLSGA